jgi:hypothetical protein
MAVVALLAAACEERESQVASIAAEEDVAPAAVQERAGVAAWRAAQAELAEREARAVELIRRAQEARAHEAQEARARAAQAALAEVEVAEESFDWSRLKIALNRALAGDDEAGEEESASPRKVVFETRQRARRESRREAAEEMERSADAPEIGEWQPLFEGLDFTTVQADSPRRMHGTAVRADLRAPGIEIFTTPSNGPRPGDTDGLRTSTFLKTYRCQAAINASIFSGNQDREGSPHDIRGLAVSQGELVSDPRGGYPAALLFTRDNKATVAEQPFDLDGVYNAVSGFAKLLADGEVQGRNDRQTHPRSSAGVSRDGRYLYLLTIDGRQHGHSIGATERDVAVSLKALGAWDGINLDGGGTATMVVEGRNGRAEVVSRPIHHGDPGRERVAGSHLGVRARPLARR